MLIKQFFNVQLVNVTKPKKNRYPKCDLRWFLHTLDWRMVGTIDISNHFGNDGLLNRVFRNPMDSCNILEAPTNLC